MRNLGLLFFATILVALTACSDVVPQGGAGTFQPRGTPAALTVTSAVATSAYENIVATGMANSTQAAIQLTSASIMLDNARAEATRTAEAHSIAMEATRTALAVSAHETATVADIRIEQVRVDAERASTRADYQEAIGRATYATFNALPFIGAFLVVVVVVSAIDRVGRIRDTRAGVYAYDTSAKAWYLHTAYETVTGGEEEQPSDPHGVVEPWYSVLSVYFRHGDRHGFTVRSMNKAFGSDGEERIRKFYVGLGALREDPKRGTVWGWDWDLERAMTWIEQGNMPHPDGEPPDFYVFA